MSASLSIRHLTKQFDANRVLKGIDLEIPGGRFVILLGPSGCGKTTLLRAISGIATASSGEIWLNERRIDAVPPEKRNFGLVFQTYALFPHMSVAKNVAFGLEMRHVGKAETDRRVAAALALVGLEDYATRLPKQLSGGQQQRVALARVQLWSYLGGEVLVLPTAAVVTFILLAPMLIVFVLAERIGRDDMMAAGLGKL
jgi:putative spermidine/putrescine transport system ATP-binding protein